MTKVLHVTKHLRPGGRERIIVDICNELCTQSIEPTVCCLISGGSLKNELKSNVKVINLNKKKGVDLKVVLRLLKYVKINKINVIHSHNPGTLFYCVFAKLFLPDVIIVNTEHGFVDKQILRKKIKENILYKFLDYNVAVSENLKKIIINTSFFKSNNNLITIYNGAPDEKVNETKIKSKNRYDMDPDIFNIGVVARLEKIKNHEGLIREFKRVLEYNSKMHLWIAGAGKQEGFIRKIIKILNVASKVTVMGERNDIKYFLNAIDLFVLPSLSEGLPISVIEAMRAKLPIIVTDVGGNNELIINNFNGILVNINRFDNLRYAILKTFTDTLYRNMLGENARKTYLNNFTIENTAIKYRHLYEAHKKKN